MRRSAGERIFDCINVLLLLGIMAVSIYPLLYVLNSSVSDPNELLRSRSLMLLPEGFQLEAYKAVFQNSKIYSGYLNTLFM